MTIVINGNLLAKEIYNVIKNKAKIISSNFRTLPSLATILIGSNASSEIYVKEKIKIAHQLGIKTELIRLESNVSSEKLEYLIKFLNKKTDVTAILVQLPIPRHINPSIIFKSIDYKKDVDAFSVYNTGLLNHWEPKIMPCTPQGILFVLKKYIKNLCGKKVLILGRSIIVGRPMSSILIQESCTVTIAHSKTREIQKECKSADIVIAATGTPNLVKASWIKKGAFVIDVGINRVDQKLVGDIDFSNILGIASYVTPVPGGIGPLTIANLMLNIYRLFYIQNNINDRDLFIK